MTRVRHWQWIKSKQQQNRVARLRGEMVLLMMMEVEKVKDY
jgi:hypothetical protein